MATKNGKTNVSSKSIVDQLSAPVAVPLFPSEAIAKDGTKWVGMDVLAAALGWQRPYNAAQFTARNAKAPNVVARRVTKQDPESGAVKAAWYVTESSLPVLVALRDAYMAQKAQNGNGKSIAEQLAG